MLINFLFYSSESNDNLKHVLGMVYKNKELEAPNYNSTYYQTKSIKNLIQAFFFVANIHLQDQDNAHLNWAQLLYGQLHQMKLHDPGMNGDLMRK
jgi:hypothetical protein